MEARVRARKKSIDNRQFLIAISENNYEELSRLLKIIDIDFKDQDGSTPLHWAVEIGDMKIIDILLKEGAQVHNKNNNNETPIDIAKRMNQLDILNMFEISLHTDTKDKQKITVKTKTAVYNRDHTVSQGCDIWINPIHGYIYQLKVLMLFLHRGLSCQYSFRVGTEIKEAKKFDDLVFEYVHGNKKVYRLLQAKHKIDESKKITVDKLLSDPNGDYNLAKYFHSFQACRKDKFFKDGIIKDVIICTNIDFDLSDLKKCDIEIIEVNEKDDILDLRSNEKKPSRYRFTNSIIKGLKYKLKQVVADDEIEHFLKHLIFAVNQPNEEELGEIVKSEIGSEMSFLDTEKAYGKLLIKMMDLMLGKGGSMFLSHEEGKTFFDDLKKEMPIWFNIQDPVMSFTGRSEYLKNMHKVLMNKLNICISGMGGVGKTELVRKYIADYGHEYGNQIVWINAECYQTAAESFRQLAFNKLNISLKSSDGKEKHITAIVTDVYQFFSQAESLFIFDNAEKYKCANELDCGIDQFLPCLSNESIKPHIIITSRNQKWPKSIETILLEPFKTEEARELVEKVLILGSEKEKAMIVDLCNKLQSLPLALQQAVAYINMQKEKLSCIGSTFEISDYLKTYSSMAHKLLNSEFPEDSDSSYNKSVFATWNITFDALKQKQYGNDALNILNIISYFLPDNIPVELLLIFSTDKVKLSSAIGLLKQYSIVSVQHKALSVHRLVQQVTRIKLQKQNNELKILQNALKLLNEDNIDDKNVEHVITMWTYAKKHKKLLQVYSNLSNVIIKHLHCYGRVGEAHSIAVEVLKILNTLPQNNIDNQVHLLCAKNNLGKALLHKGEYHAALKLFEEMQEVGKKIPGRSVNENLSVKSSIAQTLIRLGRYNEALKHYHELLDAKKGVLNSNNHSDILTIKNDISHILLAQGKYQESLSISEEIYRVQKATLGERHPLTLLTRNNIAAALGKMNRYDEALAIWKEIDTSIMRDASLPKDHPAVIDIKFNIATGLLAQDKPNSALKIYRELRDIQIKKFGENHHETMSVDVYIATILAERGEHEKALKIFENAFNILQTDLGPMHPETFRAQEGLGDVLLRQKNYKVALKIYEDFLDKHIIYYGNDHKNTFEVRKSIVNILVELEKYEAALSAALETFHNAESIYGKNHPSTFFFKRNVAWLYSYNNDFDNALLTLEQLLKVQESCLGKNHVDCQDTRGSLFEIRQERNEFERQRNKKETIVINNEVLTVIKNGDTMRLEQLLKKVTNINVTDAEGRTVLHHAANIANEKIIGFLLDHGAEIFVTTHMGNTPLHIAVSKNKVDIVKLLLQKIELEQLNDFVDAKTISSASTALHVAAKMGYIEIVKQLLKNHATFCATSKDGKTPLDLSSHPETMKLLTMVHESFENVIKADHATEVVGKLATLPLEEFLAVTNTRNNRGCTLSQVAILNRQKSAAIQILQMVQKLNLN